MWALKSSFAHDLQTHVGHVDLLEYHIRPRA